jgi:hypothetical protein
VKINKVEVEMTKEEKRVYDAVRNPGGCRYVECRNCPLAVTNNKTPYAACILKDLPITIKTVGSPPKLHKGMGSNEDTILKEELRKEN